MVIKLLDGSLAVEVYYEEMDNEFEDNICVCFFEGCPPEEKIFRVGETHIYLTSDQARKLAQVLLKAADASQQAVQT